MKARWTKIRSQPLASLTLSFIIYRFKKIYAPRCASFLHALEHPATRNKKKQEEFKGKKRKKKKLGAK
jgi:hypothetical protein